MASYSRGDAKVSIGVCTISDRASKGAYDDRGGPAIVEELGRILRTPWQPELRLIPDEPLLIEQTLIELCDKLMPGFGEKMCRASLKSVPTVILSRQTAGIRGQSLIINLPGKPATISECLGAIFAAVSYCIELIGGPMLETNPAVINAFRPRS